MDWDDTIGDFHDSEIHALSDIYNKYRLNNLYSSFEEYYLTYHPFNIHLWELYGNSLITKQQLQFQRFFFPLLSNEAQKQVRECGTDIMQFSTPELSQTAKLIGEDFCRLTLEYGTILPDSADTIRQLAKKYPLTIVSNGFVEMQYVKIKKSGLADCFKHVVLSEEAGVQKPNPLIYKKALQLNGISADEAVMIGDSYSSDIQGAINAGIDQIWITRQPATQPATYIVKQLKEVLNIL